MSECESYSLDVGSGTIVLAQHVDMGAPGEDSDAFNPLARATRTLLAEGASFKSAASVFFGDSVAGVLRWFGLFVEADSGRVVFFPGLDRRPDVLGFSRAGHPERTIPHLADHVTLEPGRDRWHSTEDAGTGSRTRSKRGRQGGMWTRPIGEGRVLWFGMSIPSADVLRVTRADTIARAPAPSNRDEAARRMKIFQDAIDTGGKAPVLTVPGAPPFPASALHFSVVVAPHGAPDYTGPERGLGRTGPGFNLLAVDGMTTGFHSIAFGLGSAIRLQLFAMWIPAKVAGPMTLHGTDATRSSTVRG